MASLGAFILGLLVGFVIGFYVYRNNIKRFQETEAQLEVEYKAKLEAVEASAQVVKDELAKLKTELAKKATAKTTVKK